MVAFTKEGAYTVTATPHARLALMVQFAREIAPLLLGLDWAVLHAPPKKSYVATDNPFIVTPPRGQRPSVYGIGILTPGASKFVPLGPRIGLLMGERGDRMLHLDIQDAAMRELNLAVTVRAEGYVFARDERLLRSLVARTKLATRPRVPMVDAG